MLYIVGTPIGNLEDFSIRQAKTIAACDVLLSEDTRSTGLLIPRLKQLFPLEFNTNQQIISYYKDTEYDKLPHILELLEQDKNVALISEAGMPLISDPGYLLISTAVKKNIPFTVIPGPTAATTALVYSGFNPHPHVFLGFLPKRENLLIKLIERMQQMRDLLPEVVIVCYESPERIQDTLKLLDQHLPQCRVAVCRELTKKFEEISRGKPSELFDRTYKGEITLVIK
ncbi:MAG: ribosomal small subunit methyltransferase [Candidatus Parcubacteria bacterium]|jgi:16S rRNA (cytidine1402-2'-O)-methyltransferase